MSSAANSASTPTRAAATAAGASTATSAVVIGGVSHLSQAQAAAVDEELFSSGGFSVDQLMELAGLSCACAVAEVYPVQSFPTVLIICGPGNNGGDGLVAGRHLHHFGFRVTVCYPKRTSKPLYDGLVKQLQDLNVPFIEAIDLPCPLAGGPFSVVVDAIFGFSFAGAPRPPFDSVLSQLAGLAGRQGAPPLVSVDIPSGWDVEQGDVGGKGIKPDMLISLTAPKLAARAFQGRHHYLGGRFLPPSLVAKYSLALPPFPGASMCVRLGGASGAAAAEVPGNRAAPAVPPAAEPLRGAPAAVDVAALRKDYVGRVLLEEHALRDPMRQFGAWFGEAVAEGVPEPNGMALCSVGAGGSPSCRIVLLKGFDERGFVWYTNYGSRKAAELLATKRAALTFWWEKQNRQVRIEGTVEEVSAEESDAYFHSRPRGSQVGALASAQSSVVGSRAEIDAQYERLAEQYLGQGSEEPIPRPALWGGFRLSPAVVEFWQGRSSRLHDRLRYRKADSLAWIMERLAP